MIRITIFLLFGLLASGCGLFKKSTKTDHRSTTTEKIDSTSRTQITEKAQTVTVTDEHTLTTTTIKGDVVRLDPQGVLEAKGNAEGVQTRLEDRQVKQEATGEKITDERKDYAGRSKEVIRDSEKVSEPDQKAIGKLIAWVTAFAVIIGVMFWALNRIRKNLP